MLIDQNCHQKKLTLVLIVRENSQNYHHCDMYLGGVGAQSKGPIPKFVLHFYGHRGW